MRGWMLLAGLLAAPAWAGDGLAEMNAVSRTWDRYAELSSRDKAESVDLLAASSLAHFGFLRDAALYASPEQLRRIPSADRVLVYLLRASQRDAALAAMDDRAVAALCITEGWAGVQQAHEGQPLIALTHVTLVDDRAVGEVAPPTEAQFQFGPAFVREQGQWRYQFESMVPDLSAVLENAVKESGLGSTQVMEIAVGNLLDAESPPSLATLDRAPLDDAAARQRLNEHWPDYPEAYRLRVRAVQRKAEDGDAFAQFVVGTLLYTGEMADVLSKDEAAGLGWLEKASDGGHGRAAWLAFMALMDGDDLDEATAKRALPHLQRAAARGEEPMAMTALGSYYFDGLAGLPRDCRQAAEWQARAEEAGARHARNEQVWTWATCPVGGQRDPARALELAQFMMKQKDRLSWHELDTVAAALAANGRFPEAVQYQAEAVEKMSADGDYTGRKRTATLKRMKARLGHYRNQRDYVVDYRAFDEMRAGNL